MITWIQSKEVQEKSSQGEAAMTEGRRLLKDISTYFEEMKNSYHDIYNRLSIGMEEIASARKDFLASQRQIENVVAISQQNTASTEEILSTLDNEHSLITSINTAVEEMNHLSRQLREMTKK